MKSIHWRILTATEDSACINKYIYFDIFFQTSMSVLEEHIHVVPMLCAPTLRDRSSVHAKLDTLEMEISALNVIFFLFFFFLRKLEPFALMLNALHYIL